MRARVLAMATRTRSALGGESGPHHSIRACSGAPGLVAGGVVCVSRWRWTPCR